MRHIRSSIFYKCHRGEYLSYTPHLYGECFGFCRKIKILTIWQNIFRKAESWGKHKGTPVNERQLMMINRLFDGFFGKLTSPKWAKITKTSTDTALRDLKDLIGKGILTQGKAGGRSANYTLIN